MSDLRESGQLEQDADAVLLIHRPEREEDTEVEDCGLIISKNRNGPTGLVEATFHRKLMKFTETV